MIKVISAGINSGKSEYGEKVVADMEGNKYYIATMRIKSDEDKARVSKHRARRENLGFVTIEQDVAIVKAIDKIKWMESLLGKSEGRRVAFIECLPNLCANEMFLESGETVPHKDVENTILCGLAILQEFFDDIVVVTDDDPDVSYYRGVTTEDKDQIEEYKAAMKELNAAFKSFAAEIHVPPF